MNHKLLEGKIALITGSSRGIGRSTALAMLAAGAKVIITYKKNKKMSEALKNSAGSKEVLVSPLDVNSRPSIRNLKRRIIAAFGRIDILVNNAGINQPNDFDKISDREWQEILNTNLSGVFKVTQEILPLIRKGGAIINIASVSGQYGGPRTTHYAVSKGGLISFTQNLARYCAHKNIRVNAVSPGLIESKMSQAAKKLGINQQILLGRMGKPEEVAEVVVFLASDGASYITAQTINVNGGLYF